MDPAGPFQSFSLFSTPPPRLTRLFKEPKNSRVKPLLPPQHPHHPSLQLQRTLPCGTHSPVPASLLEKTAGRVFSPFLKFFSLFPPFFNSLLPGGCPEQPQLGVLEFPPGKLSGCSLVHRESRDSRLLWTNWGGNYLAW